MTNFPTLLYTSACEIPTFNIPEASKRYPFRAEPPRIGHYREYPPPPGCRGKSFGEWEHWQGEGGVK